MTSLRGTNAMIASMPTFPLAMVVAIIKFLVVTPAGFVSGPSRDIVAGNFASNEGCVYTRFATSAHTSFEAGQYRRAHTCNTGPSHIYCRKNYTIRHSKTNHPGKRPRASEARPRGRRKYSGAGVGSYSHIEPEPVPTWRRWRPRPGKLPVSKMRLSLFKPASVGRIP